MDLIELHNITKSYHRGIQALVNVSFKIKKEEFVFLVGPSGAGKSTCVKLILKEEEGPP